MVITVKHVIKQVLEVGNRSLEEMDARDEMKIDHQLYKYVR